LEETIDLQYTLGMMGILIDGAEWAFEINSSEITASTIPQSSLNKCHKELSYHPVHQRISAKAMYWVNIEDKYSPIDIITQCLGWGNFWPLLEPHVFRKIENIIDKPFHTIIKIIQDVPIGA
jgi:hypothetical protein